MGADEYLITLWSALFMMRTAFALRSKQFTVGIREEHLSQITVVRQMTEVLRKHFAKERILADPKVGKKERGRPRNKWQITYVAAALWPLFAEAKRAKAKGSKIWRKELQLRIRQFVSTLPFPEAFFPSSFSSVEIADRLLPTAQELGAGKEPRIVAAKKAVALMAPKKRVSAEDISKHYSKIKKFNFFGDSSDEKLLMSELLSIWAGIPKEKSQRLIELGLRKGLVHFPDSDDHYFPGLAFIADPDLLGKKVQETHD